MPNEAVTELKPGQIEALREIAKYEGRNALYWWRRASMKVLAEHGYVETWRSPSLANYKGKQMPYRVTPAGLAAIRAIDLTKPVEG